MTGRGTIRQTDRQTGRQADRQTDRQTDSGGIAAPKTAQHRIHVHEECPF